MRFGSVCSGIEAASVAWHPLGWKAAWLSEIEPFPSAVLAHHYPNVPNLGDMTALPQRIASGEVESPDVFCGGTPCQAFSVAGLRRSLDDDRGNLSLTFCEIANEIDRRRLDAGHVPAIIFWENVPGVLNTKDNAFGCFLGALAGEDAALSPAGGRWTNAGCVYGPQRTVAWRILDAQYFGVAQRRRRVFVVASARTDFDPTAVLFESEGVRRDTAPSREAGQRVAPCVTNGPPFSRTGNERVEAEAMVVAAKSKQWPADITSTLDTTFGTKQGLEDQHVNAGCPMFVPATYAIQEEVTHTLDTAQGVAVAQPMPINTMVALRHEALGERTGFGIGEAGDPAYTLTKGHSHAVAQPITFGAQMSVPQTDVDLVQTLQAKNPMAVACIGGQHPNAAISEDQSPTLTSAMGMGGGHIPAVAQPIAFTTKLHNTQSNNAGKLFEERTPCLDANSPAPALLTAMQVRRLTPVECERLQGFPDNYTAIPWRKKLVEDCPDGPRYKALGNSWAVPVVCWIGKRIQSQLGDQHV